MDGPMELTGTTGLVNKRMSWPPHSWQQQAPSAGSAGSMPSQTLGLKLPAPQLLTLLKTPRLLSVFEEESKEML